MYRQRFITFDSAVTIALLISTLVILGISQMVDSQVVQFLAVHKKFDWTMVTHILAHGNYQHWVMNAPIIAILGPSVEEKYGSLTTLMMIVITAFIVGIVSHSIGESCIGLSTICYMFIMLNAFRGSERGIPFIVLFLAAVEIVPEFFASNTDQIAHWAHITGAFCGIGFGLLTKFFRFNRRS